MPTPYQLDKLRGFRDAVGPTDFNDESPRWKEIESLGKKLKKASMVTLGNSVRELGNLLMENEATMNKAEAFAKTEDAKEFNNWKISSAPHSALTGGIGDKHEKYTKRIEATIDSSGVKAQISNLQTAVDRLLDEDKLNG